jgi:hypothetical protein
VIKTRAGVPVCVAINACVEVWGTGIEVPEGTGPDADRYFLVAAARHRAVRDAVDPGNSSHAHRPGADAWSMDGRVRLPFRLRGIERARVAPTDRLAAHDLEPADLPRLRAQARRLLRQAS